MTYSLAGQRWCPSLSSVAVMGHSWFTSSSYVEYPTRNLCCPNGISQEIISDTKYAICSCLHLHQNRSCSQNAKPTKQFIPNIISSVASYPILYPERQKRY